MSKMVRKQIYIYKRQQAMLKRLSEQRGVSEAEIVRQAIDQQAANTSSRVDIAGQEAWEQAHQFMLSMRGQTDRFTAPYRWNRDDLYEDRLNRYETNRPKSN